MNHWYFVTGTDTGVGKTFVAAALLARARGLGFRTAAFKPVAAGAERTHDGLRNEDGLILQRAISQSLTYEQVNPVCLEPAIAPHIAAREAGVCLDVESLQAAFSDCADGGGDFGLVEGAGGWRVPLNERETFADLARALKRPVILVVAMRLGCINHALLTAEAIARDGLDLAGWVANRPGTEFMARYRENLATLEALLPAPLLGELPPVADGDWRRGAAYLRLPNALENGPEAV